MSKRWYWISLLFVLPLFAMTACDSDDGGDDPKEETTFDVVAEATLAYIANSEDAPGVISAEKVFTDGVENFTIIDIRQPQHYAMGHIAGAVNSALKDVVTTVEGLGVAKDAPIVVVCYSGQSAGHAKVALELMGYTETKSLLFGMSSWNSKFAGSWDNKVGDALPTAETTNNELTETHDFPVLTEDKDTALATRVQAMLDDGFQGISYAKMVENGIDEYFIVNYFGEADYLGTGESGVPGHIPGAYQFTPYSSLAVDAMLPYLPTNKPIVVYCWTGQHSSQVVAALNVMGYEALSLTNGSNALFHTDLTAHKWTDNAKHDYAIDEGVAADAVFTALADAGSAYINDSAKCPGVMKAADLNTNGIDNYAIFDMRSAEHYGEGHIEGAINTSLGTILTDVAANVTDKGDAIVVACYTGQTAGHAKIALELMGYTNVKSLLFGMSAWNSTLNKMDANLGDNLATAETDNNNDMLVGHLWPEMTGYDAATVVETRATEVLADGFKAISYADYVANGAENYFVMNYFGEGDYLGTGDSGVPGHIPGAYQFTPYKSLGLDEMLMYLPTDMPIIVYCWTGQHSSQVTFYLNMLGYEAYSLKFGSNGLFHSDLTAHKWSDGATNDFPVVPTN